MEIGQIAYPKKVIAYILSLPQSMNRLEMTKRECERLNIPVRRVTAMNPTEGANWLATSALSGGALGLCASVDFALTLMDQENSDWILLLEDDAKFCRRVKSIEQILDLTTKAKESVGAVHLGYMTGNEIWWQQYPIAKRIKIMLRPRSRLRALRARLGSVDTSEFQTKPSLVWGSQALLVRRDLSSEVRGALAKYDVPQDHKLNYCVREMPDLFVRTNRPYVTQRAGKSVRLEVDRT